MQQGLANAIIADLATAIKYRGQGSLVLSGGNTPKRLFQILSTKELDWAKVQVTLADDRWLGEDHTDSNERLVKDNLLQGPAAQASFIGLKTAASSPYEGAADCHKNLSAIPLPYDVTLLGMGTDGHTASLFPCSDELDRAVTDDESLCCAVTPKTAPYERMTLTLKTLLKSSKLYLQLAGDSKLEVYKSACDGDDEKAMPVRYFLKQEQSPLFVYWAPQEGTV